MRISRRCRIVIATLLVGIMLALAPTTSYAKVNGFKNLKGNLFTKSDPANLTKTWGSSNYVQNPHWKAAFARGNAALKHKAPMTTKKLSTTYKGKPVVQVNFTNKYVGHKVYDGFYEIIVDPWDCFRVGGTSDTYTSKKAKHYILLRKGETVRLYPQYYVWFNSLPGCISFSNTFDYQFVKPEKRAGDMTEYNMFPNSYSSGCKAGTHLPKKCYASYLKSNGYTYRNKTGKDIYLLINLNPKNVRI